MKPVAIIGGGISGLSAAYYLSQAGVPFTLFEAGSRLGGVVRTDHTAGCLIEAGPDSWIAQKPAALDLVRELALESELIGSNDHLRKTYIVRRGELIPIPDGMQFLAPTKLMPVLTSRLFGLRTKLRMGLDLLRRPVEHSERTVAEFVRDHFGDELNEYLAQPMLAGVYGGSPEQLSVDSVLPMFVEYERRFGSISRAAITKKRAGSSGSLFLTLRAGLGSLVQALEKAVEGSGKIVFERVHQISRQADHWTLKLEHGNFEAEHVVAAMPANSTATLLRSSSSEVSDLLAAIPYSSSITSGLVYRRPEFDHSLDGFGVLIPRKENRALAACTWVERKFDHRTAGGATLMRAFFAGDAADNLMGASDQAIETTTHTELSELMRFDAKPVDYRVNRWPKAMALYTVGHGTRLAKIKELTKRLPGLHLGGNGYDGIGIPDCIRRSKAIAASISGG